MSGALLMSPAPSGAAVAKTTLRPLSDMLCRRDWLIAASPLVSIDTRVVTGAGSPGFGAAACAVAPTPLPAAATVITAATPATRRIAPPARRRPYRATSDVLAPLSVPLSPVRTGISISSLIHPLGQSTNNSRHCTARVYQLLTRLVTNTAAGFP